MAQRGGWLKLFRDVAVILLAAIVISVVVKTFIVRAFYIPSQSMETTLMVNDRILVNELAPRFGDIHRGDVVVFKDPGGWLGDVPKPQSWTLQQGIDDLMTTIGLSAGDSDEYLIKRVIGVAGDTVACKSATGPLTVNGVRVQEDYIAKGSTPCTDGFLFKVKVPKDSYWVMGDNRQDSADSSHHTDLPGNGTVPKADITGKAFVITFPFDRFGGIDDHHSAFKSVPAAKVTANSND